MSYQPSSICYQYWPRCQISPSPIFSLILAGIGTAMVVYGFYASTWSTQIENRIYSTVLRAIVHLLPMQCILAHYRINLQVFFFSFAVYYLFNMKLTLISLNVTVKSQSVYLTEGTKLCMCRSANCGQGKCDCIHSYFPMLAVIINIFTNTTLLVPLAWHPFF